MGLRTLGGLELSGTGFGQRQALLLLTFLAIEGPQERSYLAELFWAGAKKPRNNLSSAITRLRATDGSLIEADASKVRTSVEVDALALIGYRTAGDTASALALYGGRFLDGVDLARLPLELEEWALDQRLLLAETARDAAAELALEAEARADTMAAVRFAEQAVVIGTDAVADIDQVVVLARILSAGGSPLIYRVAQQARELGIELPSSDPPERTARLQVESAARQPPPGAFGDSGQLPAGHDFFGRSEELHDVGEALAASKPVVIAGLGGVGKSRLASQAAWMLGDAHGPTLWVDLQQVVDGAQLPDTIGTVAFPGHEPAEDMTGLASMIGDRRAIMVLDNFEQLADDVMMIEPLIRSCPDLSLIITSRTQLALEDAVTLKMSGLPVRSEDGTAPGAAVDLLRSALTRRGPQPDPSALDDGLAIEICSMLDGLPLAIELAAGWSSVLTASETADELRRHEGLLDYDDPFQPEHHRSIASVMERSWGLLDEAARRAMNRLSMFPAGFGLDAAKAVGECDAGILRYLSERSLIHRSRDAYYQRHPLVRDYGRAQLESNRHLEQSARRAHAHLIRSWLEDVPRSERAESVSTLDGVEDEAANLLLAWTWAVEVADVGLIAALADALGRSLSRSGRHRDALALFETAADQLGSDPANQSTTAMLLMQRVWFHIVLGETNVAARLCDKALSYDLREDPELLLELTRARATIERHEGNVEAALDRLVGARPVIELASSRMKALVTEDIGDCQMVLGMFDDAVQSFDFALGMARNDHSSHGVVRSLLGLATSLLDAGRPSDALVHLGEASTVVDGAGLTDLQPHVASKQAIANLSIGDLAAARDAVALAREHTDLLAEQWMIIELDLTSAQIEWATNQSDGTVEHLERALELAADIGDVPLLARGYVTIVELISSAEPLGPAELRLLRCVAHHSGADYVDRARALTLLEGRPTDPGQVIDSGPEVDLFEDMSAALGLLRTWRDNTTRTDSRATGAGRATRSS